MNNKAFLTEWTIAIMNATDKKKQYIDFELDEQPRFELNDKDKSIIILKTLRNGELSGKFVTMDKAILSKQHEKIDFSPDELNNMRGYTGSQIRAIRPLERGLLILYPLYGNKNSENNSESVKNKKNENRNMYGLEYPVFGAVISFPGLSKKEKETSYILDEKSLQIEIPYSYE